MTATVFQCAVILPVHDFTTKRYKKGKEKGYARSFFIPLIRHTFLQNLQSENTTDKAVGPLEFLQSEDTGKT